MRMNVIIYFIWAPSYLLPLSTYFANSFSQAFIAAAEPTLFMKPGFYLIVANSLLPKQSKTSSKKEEKICCKIDNHQTDTNDANEHYL